MTMSISRSCTDFDVLPSPSCFATPGQRDTSLMNEMGLSEYCHDIGHMNAPKLIEQFQNLEKHSSEVKDTIRESVEAQRRALEEQYSLLFDER